MLNLIKMNLKQKARAVQIFPKQTNKQTKLIKTENIKSPSMMKIIDKISHLHASCLVFFFSKQLSLIVFCTHMTVGGML